jgi:hypothetical protein
MIHPENIAHYPGTLTELAGELGDLRCDALAVLLRALARKLEADAATDAGRGRHRLAAALRGSAAGVSAAATEIERAWQSPLHTWNRCLARRSSDWRSESGPVYGPRSKIEHTTCPGRHYGFPRHHVPCSRPGK